MYNDRMDEKRERTRDEKSSRGEVGEQVVSQVSSDLEADHQMIPVAMRRVGRSGSTIY